MRFREASDEVPRRRRRSSSEFEVSVKVNQKAILWGVGVFSTLYVLHLLLLPLLVGTEDGGKSSDPVLYGIHQLLGLSTCLVGGFVAARIAGGLGFLHGLIVGMGGTLLSIVAATLWALVAGGSVPNAATLPFWMMVNGFLGAFGGLVAANLTEDDGP